MDCSKWRILSFNAVQDAGDDTHWTCSKVVAGCHVGATRGELKWKGYARNR
jgi:hypothetical protein